MTKVLRYLSGIQHRGIVYGGAQDTSLYGYKDSDWAGDPDSARFTAGYVFILNGGVTSWRSSKQKSVTKSTTETEYMASSDAAQEAVWARYLN